MDMHLSKWITLSGSMVAEAREERAGRRGGQLLATMPSVLLQNTNTHQPLSFSLSQMDPYSQKPRLPSTTRSPPPGGRSGASNTRFGRGSSLGSNNPLLNNNNQASSTSSSGGIIQRRQQRASGGSSNIEYYGGSPTSSLNALPPYKPTNNNTPPSMRGGYTDDDLVTDAETLTLSQSDRYVSPSKSMTSLTQKQQLFSATIPSSSGKTSSGSGVSAVRGMKAGGGAQRSYYDLSKKSKRKIVPQTGRESDPTTTVSSVSSSSPFSSSSTITMEKGPSSGLHNLGNTCFMNAPLQCLFNTPELKTYFLSSVNTSFTTSSSSGQLAASFRDVFRNVFSEAQPEASLKSSSVDPSPLKCVITHHAPQFGGGGQHDAQEFMRFLLDGLGGDLNTSKTLTSSVPSSVRKDEDDTPSSTSSAPLLLTEDELNKLSTSQQSTYWWNRHLSVNNSIIEQTFCGQLQSTLECLTCGHRSMCYDAFYDLSVTIPTLKEVVSIEKAAEKAAEKATEKATEKAAGEVVPATPSSKIAELFRSSFGKKDMSVTQASQVLPSQQSTSPPGSVTLQHCLQQFTGHETLDGDNKIQCCKCNNKRRKASKRMQVSRFPRVLVVHVKRFNYSANGSKGGLGSSLGLTGGAGAGVTTKINTPVHVPLEGLDMTPYSCITLDDDKGDSIKPEQDDPLSSSSSSSPIYDLYATTNHIGSDLRAGHYTAHCINDKDWYCFNDSIVSEKSNDGEGEGVPYLLFYRLRDAAATPG
jgi:ubiquitin C-terminal hydrolase